MKGAYIIGEPGIGKSTAVAVMVAGIAQEVRRRPFAHTVYLDAECYPVATQIGGPHEVYPGTDRLSMSVQPKAVEWVRGAPTPVVFAEGDRLATSGFLESLAENCTEWWLVKLNAPPELAERRRAGRGSEQNEQWLAGRRTKVANLAEKYADRLVEVNASMNVATTVAQLRRLVPAFAWTMKEKAATQ